MERLSDKGSPTEHVAVTLSVMSLAGNCDHALQAPPSG